MKKVMKFLAWSVLLGAILFVMAPKKNLYYFVEHWAKKHALIIGDEQFRDYGLWVGLTEGEIYYNAIPVAHVRKATLVPTFLYNVLHLEDITTTDSFQQFLPKHIHALTLQGTGVYPLLWWVRAKGDFGTLQGVINLKKRTLAFTLLPTENFASRYPALAKSLTLKEDYYTYESSY